VQGLVRFLDFKTEKNNHTITFGVVEGNFPFLYLGDRYSLIDERQLTEEDIDKIIEFLLKAKEEAVCLSSG
jgi:hypothetical protein